MKFVVIGIGGFGNNHVRVLKELGHDVITVDIDEGVNADVVNYKDLYIDENLDDLDGVIVATPASTHYEITKYFLDKGINVLTEKPVTLNFSQIEELVELARRKKVVFQAGHIFRYNPLTERMMVELKRILNEGQKILAIRSCRIGMHSPRDDCGVIWDYGIHDVDLINYILSNCKMIYHTSEVEVSKASLIGNTSFEDIASLTYFIRLSGDDSNSNDNSNSGNVYTQIDVDWISPIKNRTLTFICTDETLEADFVKEELRIHKSGILPVSTEEGEARFNIRMGDMIIPKISHEEPLKKELMDFVQCIENDEVPISNVESCLLAYKKLDEVIN